MATQVQIVNLALTRLGVTRITAVTDQVKAARAANFVWEMVRDEVLAKHAWNRITQRAKLIRTTDAAKTITGITSADPAEVTTSTPHGYVDDEIVYIQGVRGMLDTDGLTTINDLYHTVDVLSATTYSIPTMDSTTATAYSSGGLSKRVRMKRLADAKTITAATAANPCVVTSAAHGFVNGDEVYIEAVAVGSMVELNGRYYTVGTTTTDTFQLQGTDSGTYAAYTSGGTVQLVSGQLTDWAFQYQLPSDCLRVLDMPENEGREFQIEGTASLLTDVEPPLYVRYVKRATDPTIYEPLLVNALAARLALELADELTGNARRRDEAAQAYMAFLNEAKGVDLSEQTPVPFDADTWVSDRYI